MTTITEMMKTMKKDSSILRIMITEEALNPLKDKQDNLTTFLTTTSIKKMKPARKEKAWKASENPNGNRLTPDLVADL
jgi:hypothetical protein